MTAIRILATSPARILPIDESPAIQDLSQNRPAKLPTARYLHGRFSGPWRVRVQRRDSQKESSWALELCEGDFTPIIAHSARYGVQISSHLSPCSTSLSRSFLLGLRTVIDRTKEFVCVRCVALSHSPSLSS